jgi:ABC-type multidrug transport system ATPase subunit
VCDALDDSEASDELNVPRGFGGGPRGFGGGGAALDNIRDWAEETEAYAGAMLPAELRARRDKILLKWANFVQTAGSRAPPSPPIAALRNVSLRFGDEMVLREVSWELCEGQIIGVVGESGCGKSTQLRLLAGEATPALATAAAAGLATAGGGLAADRARELTGEVWVAPDAACALEYVPQGVLASLALERSPLGDYVRKAVGKSADAADGVLAAAAAEVEAVAAEEAVWAWLGWINVPIAEASDDEDEGEGWKEDEDEDEGEGWKEDEDEDEGEETSVVADAAMDEDEASSSSTTTAAFGSVAAFTAAAAVGRTLFGVDAASRPVNVLSSGQQLRLTLAIALARRPGLLLLDEPTNHLDVDGLLWLEGALQAAVRHRVVASVLAVSHDRAFLEHACTHMIDATGGGGALYRGSYVDFVAAKQRRREALESMDTASEALRREPSRNAKKRPSRFRLPVVQRAPKEVEAPLLTLTQAAIRPAGVVRGVVRDVVRTATKTGVEPEAAAALGTALGTAPVPALGTALLPAIDLEVSRGDCVFWSPLMASLTTSDDLSDDL